MSAPVADAASPGGASHPAKKRKRDDELSSVWVGGYDKAQADALLAAKEAEQAELTAKLTRARADAKAAARENAEEVAALKAKFDRVHSLAARYQRERDTARAERDAASSERDARAQERDEGAKEFAAELERCKASAKEAAAQAEQKRLALAKQLEDATKKFNGMVDERNHWQGKYDGINETLDDMVEERDNRKLMLTEAREQCKTARELGRREAEADLAAEKARADKAVGSLQAELAKSKSLEEELESVKAQLGTAKERLGQIAAFQRQQARMSAMMMNSGFMNLEDAAFPAVPAGSSAEFQVEEGEMGEILHVD